MIVVPKSKKLIGRRALLTGTLSMAAALATFRESMAAGAELASAVPTCDAFWAPNLQRLAGAPSTPENNGLCVDRTGATDNTSLLNTWLQSLVTNGDVGQFNPGTFKTSGALVASGGNSLWLSGSGVQFTVIKPTGSTYPAFHVNLPGNQFVPSGYLQGIGIVGPTARPISGQAGFLLDATTLFRWQDLDVQNCDIGFDLINNCYNSVGYNLSVARFGSCNVGINLRDGSNSGSDLKFYNCTFFPWLYAVCVKGGGGGYKFYGTEMNTQNTASADGNGVLQIGWDYIGNTSSGADGIGNLAFDAIDIEGWFNCHAIRNYGENQVTIRDCSFTATVSGATAALDILKSTNQKNGIIKFDANRVSGTFQNPELGTIAGENGTVAQALRQYDWDVAPAGYTVNGVGKGNFLTDITNV